MSDGRYEFKNNATIVVAGASGDLAKKKTVSIYPHTTRAWWEKKRHLQMMDFDKRKGRKAWTTRSLRCTNCNSGEYCIASVLLNFPGLLLI